MSAFNSNQEDVEVPIINLEAENEHFEISDLIISWIETFKSKSIMLNGSKSSSQSTKSGSLFDKQNGDSDNGEYKHGNSSHNYNREDIIEDNNKSDEVDYDRKDDDDNINGDCDSDSDSVYNGEFDTYEQAKNLRIILPPPSTHHNLSAPEVAWNLVRIFSEKQGLQQDIFPNTDSFFCNSKNISNVPNTATNHSSSNQDQVVESSPSSKVAQQMYESDATALSNYHETTKGHQQQQSPSSNSQFRSAGVRMRGNDEWAPPRAQIIFNVHQESNFRKLMQKQNYRCAGCGTKIDHELARKLVLYCHYLGKYFCKCCFSHKTIHLPGYILQRWDFHRYAVSHFALQLLDRIANEPLFNINDINPGLYRKVKKLRNLIDIRMQLFYLKIYITTCTQTDKLNAVFTSFPNQHLLQDDVHVYSLNNMIEIQHGKLYEYLSDLVARSIAHIAQCDRCRAKGHYCQLCGPSSLMSSMILNSGGGQQGTDSNQNQHQTKLKHSGSVGQNISTSGNLSKTSKTISHGETNNASRQHASSHSRSSSGNSSNFMFSTNQSGNVGITPNNNLQSSTITATTNTTNNSISVNVNDHELIFPFEIGRVAQCRACGCCFHLQCFLDADQNCPKCERIQRRRTEMMVGQQ